MDITDIDFEGMSSGVAPQAASCITLENSELRSVFGCCAVLEVFRDLK
jgi:hypothetical protein